MIYDLRQKTNISGAIQACYLAEDSARITSPEFKVWIPSIMGEIDKTSTEITIANNKDRLLMDEVAEYSDSVKCQGFITAKSIHPYRIRHDGWIPQFKIQQITSEDGSIDNIEAQSTKGTTDGVPMHPPHPITKMFKMFTNKLTSIVFNKLIVSRSTEVDYQELNNKFIKRGHLMYGCFVAGLQNQFVIIAIDGVIPYKSQSEPGDLSDNPDTSFDGGANNPPNS